MKVKKRKFQLLPLLLGYKTNLYLGLVSIGMHEIHHEQS